MAAETLVEGSRLTAEMIRDFTSRGLWGSTLLHDDLDRWAAQRPEQLAVVSPARGGASQVRLSYGELAAEVQRAAAALRGLGIQAGDVVSMQLPNWYEFLVIMLACSKLGAVINGLTPIYRQHELRFILERTASKVMVVPATFRGFDYAAMLDGLSPELPTLEQVVVVAEAAPPGMLTYDKLIAGTADESDLPTPTDANSLVQIAFTSGTTGEPKGVMHTHNTLLATVNGLIQHLELGPPQVNLIITPIGHQTGFLWGILITQMLGGTMVFQDRWDPAETVETIAREGITTTAGATTFLRDLTLAPDLEPSKVASLQTFITAGAPIPPVVVEDATAKLGCRVFSAWGMTEYGIGTAVGSRDPREKVAASDGRAVPGAEVRVVDEQGNLTAPGQEGDLQVRGAGLFVGYFKRPDFTTQSFTPDGFLMTGDRAYQDADGFVRLTGRSKDIVIRGGENIPVAEIEALIVGHPKIRDVAIVAMPHERLGEQACAYVVLKDPADPLTLPELSEYLLGFQIAIQKLPERLELIDELPRTASGKVQKFKLREDITTKLAAS
jgi:cyclohexanecarboxylate-CoA ligase